MVEQCEHQQADAKHQMPSGRSVLHADAEHHPEARDQQYRYVAHTSFKKRRSTSAISVRRCGGASCRAAGRSAKSMKLTSPNQVMAAAKCKNIINAVTVMLQGCAAAINTYRP